MTDALRALVAKWRLRAAHYDSQGRKRTDDREAQSYICGQAHMLEMCADELEAVPAGPDMATLAAWIRTPGNINRDDAIDECARLLENNAAALSAVPAELNGDDARAWMGAAAEWEEKLTQAEVRIRELEAALSAVPVGPVTAVGLSGNIIMVERAEPVPAEDEPTPKDPT